MTTGIVRSPGRGRGAAAGTAKRWRQIPAILYLEKKNKCGNCMLRNFLFFHFPIRDFYQFCKKKCCFLLFLDHVFGWRCASGCTLCVKACIRMHAFAVRCNYLFNRHDWHEYKDMTCLKRRKFRNKLHWCLKLQKIQVRKKGCIHMQAFSCIQDVSLANIWSSSFN